MREGGRRDGERRDSETGRGDSDERDLTQVTDTPERAVRNPTVARTKPWQGARTGAAMRLGASEELLTLVAFDVSCDRTRKRAADLCKDYGLRRTQWSVFEGPTTRNRREELWDRLAELFTEAEGGGRLALYPIGAREAVWARREAVRGTVAKQSAGGGRSAGGASSGGGNPGERGGHDD